MKNILILTIILSSVGIIALKATGSEQLEGVLTVDFKEESAVYVESTTMSASVDPNWCNTCIRLFQPSQCLDICEDKVIYD